MPICQKCEKTFTYEVQTAPGSINRLDKCLECIEDEPIMNFAIAWARVETEFENLLEENISRLMIMVETPPECFKEGELRKQIKLILNKAMLDSIDLIPSE